MGEQTEMAQTFDRELVGKFLRRVVAAQSNWTVAAARCKVSRATLYRVRDGNPNVEHSTLRRIETGLRLPYETFSYVGMREYDSLREIGVPEDLVRWLERNDGSVQRGGRSAM